MQDLGWHCAHPVRIFRLLVITATLWQAAGYGQVRSRSGFEVRGEILDGVPGNLLRVSLSRTIDAGRPLSADVGPAGDFTFASVSRGTYLLQVKDFHGGTIYERPVTISGSEDHLTVHLPEGRGVRPASDTVSVRELQRKIAPKARKEHEKGLRDFRSKKYKNAISHFQKAIRFDPSFAEAHNMLGASFSSLKQYGEAAKEFRAATELDPDSGPFACNLALAMAALEQYPESEASARAALAADRNLKEAHYLLGFSRFKQAKYDQETVENLEWAAIAYPKAHIFAAEVLERLGRKNQAADELRGYLKSSDEGADRKKLQAWLTDLTGLAARQR